MKRFTLALLMFALLGATVSAQAPRRVRFPRGRTTTILNGNLKGDEIARYAFSARAGQTLIAHVTSPNGGAKFDVYLIGERDIFGDGEDVKDWQGTLPKSGEYVVSVYAVKPRARYTLEVTIR